MLFSPKRTLLHAMGSPLQMVKPSIETWEWCDFIRQRDCLIVPTRERLYRRVQSLIGDAPIDYLEFGVADGDSMREWLALNQQPASRFIGFDSFEGLPEQWGRNGMGQGAFDRGGQPPVISDSRLHWEVGWFQDTVPTFLQGFAPRHRIVLHNDSDLYSSTLYTLTRLHDVLVPESIVMFDEFYDARHEYRALVDYASAYRRTFRMVGATTHYNQVAIVLE